MASFSLQSVFVVDQNVLRLAFSGLLTDSPNYERVDNFVLSNTTGSTTPLIDKVLPYREDSPQFIYLVVKGLVLGDTYRITVNEGTLRSISGGRVVLSAAMWTQNRTKVDAALANVVSFYNVDQGSVFKTLLQSIMISDETIGGAFDNKITPAVKRYGGNWGGSDWGGSNWGGA